MATNAASLESTDTITRDSVRRAQAGSVADRNRVITDHLRLVQREARRYQRPEHVDDLVQVGVLGHGTQGGLMRAVMRYDPDSPIAFTAYARRCITDAMSKYIEDIDHPTCPWRTRARLRNEAVQTADRLGSHDPEAVQQALADGGRKLPIAAVRQLLANRQWSPIRVIYRDPDSLSGEEIASVDDQAAAGERQRKLATAIDRTLSPLDRTIVRMYYGIDGNRAMTHAQIGKAIFLTASAVRSRLRRALAALQADPELQGL